MKIDPTNFGGHNHLVSAAQHQGIRKNYRSTPPITVSAWSKIEKKRQDRNMKLDMEQFIVTRNIVPNKSLGMKEPSVYYDALQPGDALAR